MVISGETAGTLGGVVCECYDGKRRELSLSVCLSGAGYYIGYWCPMCGPYSRESGYYKTRDEAQHELDVLEGVSTWR